MTSGDAAKPLPKIHTGYEESKTTMKQIEATVAVFGQSIDEDPDDVEYEERKKKIEEYLDTLDPKKRQWEEKKIEHYRREGKDYLLPGEKAEKRKRKLRVSLEEMRIDPKNIFANGQLKSLSI